MSTSAQKGAMTGLEAIGKGVGVKLEIPLLKDKMPFVHTWRIYVEFRNQSGVLTLGLYVNVKVLYFSNNIL